MQSPKELFKRNKYKFFFLVSLTILLLVGVFSAIFFPLYYGSMENMTERMLYGLMADMSQVYYFSLSKNPYATTFGTIYLPLAVIIMKPFALIGKNSPVFYMLNDYPINGTVISPSEGLDSEIRFIDIFNLEILQTREFWIATVLYYVIIFILLALVAWKMRKWESVWQFLCAYFAVFFSGFVIVGILRGTNVFTCLLLLMLFYKLYNGKKAWQREIALVCLAVAGVLRLYPLLFGAILIRDKKWLACVRVAAYTLLLAILPFAFYGNILEVAGQYFHKIKGFVGGQNRMGGSMNLSVYSFFGYFFNRLGITNKAVHLTVGLTATAIALVSSIAVSVFSRSRFVALIAVVAGILTVTPVSYYYVTMLFIIPLFALIDEWKSLDAARKRLYTILYLVLGFLPTALMAWYIPQIILLAFTLIYEFVRLIKDRKSAYNAIKA